MPESTCSKTRKSCTWFAACSRMVRFGGRGVGAVVRARGCTCGPGGTRPRNEAVLRRAMLPQQLDVLLVARARHLAHGHDRHRRGTRALLGTSSTCALALVRGRASAVWTPVLAMPCRCRSARRWRARVEVARAALFLAGHRRRTPALLTSRARGARGGTPPASSSTWRAACRSRRSASRAPATTTCCARGSARTCGGTGTVAVVRIIVLIALVTHWCGVAWAIGLLPGGWVAGKRGLGRRRHADRLPPRAVLGVRHDDHRRVRRRRPRLRRGRPRAQR